MGRIQVARDRRLGREIALKEILVHRGATRRRFEREARITARLQHPSIVGVYEAGVWPSGEPFYAMPLLSGRSLDEALADAKTLAGRLALVPNVLAIADAMAYAHGRRVIHRDLKPRNVIVGEFGETVVIDWGIAKEIDVAESPESLGTASQDSGPSAAGSSTETTEGDVLGTPAYMPPEQASGAATVDERADVYSIGAILYHLLAGVGPFLSEGKSAILAAVITETPRPVQELAPQAPRELVAIVGRAMAQDREKRYPTARELAEDLRRFQTGQLVAAHRYSRVQRLRRWISRHRTGIAATTAALVVAVVIGVIALTRIFEAQRQVEHEREIAIANQNRAEELLRFMLVELREQLVPLGRLELLDNTARRAIAHYDARGPATSVEDLYLASLARQGIASVLKVRNDLPSAIAEFQKAYAGFDQAATLEPTVIKYQAHRARVGFALARLTELQGDLKTGLAMGRVAIARIEPLYALHPEDAELTSAIQDGHKVLAELHESLGDTEQALSEYRQLLGLVEAEVARNGSPTTQRRLLTIHSGIGRMLEHARHDSAAALVEYRKGLAIGEEMRARDPQNPRRIADVAISHGQLANTLLDTGDIAGAMTEAKKGVALLEVIVEMDPSNIDFLGHLNGAYEKLGMAAIKSKDNAAALAAYRKFRDGTAEIYARDPSNTDNQRSLTLALNKMADIQLATKDATGALASIKEGLAIRQRLVAKDPDNANWRRDLFYSHYKIALAYYGMPDRKPEALAALRTSLAVANENLARKPKNRSFQADVAEVHNSIGELLGEMGDRAGARTEIETALELARGFAGTGSSDWTERLAKFEKSLAELSRSR